MAFNYISFLVAKQTQTIQSLFFFVIIQSLSSFCSHSAINQSLLPGHLYSVSANPLLHPVSLHKSYICTHFRFLLQWITSSHKMAKTQSLNYMESRIPHAKLGFATTAKFSTPTGEQTKYEVTQKNTYDEEIIFDDIWRPNNNLHVKPFRAQL